MAEEPSQGDHENDDDHEPVADDPGPDDAPPVENPFSTDDPAADVPAGGSSDGDTVEGDPDGDAPLGDLAREVSRRRRRGDDGSGPDSDADPFERVDVGDLDEDELWASLSGEESAAGTDAAGAQDTDASIGAATATEPDAVPVDGVDAGDTRPEHVLDKRKYCQRCPHLTAPPELACEHDGTDILEVVDAERFRVRGCPMVTDEGRPTFSTADEAGRSESSMPNGEASDLQAGSEPTGERGEADGEVDVFDGDGSVADDFDA